MSRHAQPPSARSGGRSAPLCPRSTIGVYGAALDGVLDEATETRPDNIYGVTKLEAEN